MDRIAQIDKYLDQEELVYQQRTPSSLRKLQSNVRYLPLGVASSFQSHYPYSLVIDHGNGAYVHDVDNHRYLDLHSGFGSNVFGHAHPVITEALQRQITKGVHFAAPIEEIDEYTEELCYRIGMDQVRLCTSGTEATMDAIRLARAATGRDKIIKIEGSYHGHHDLALVSVKPNVQKAGSYHHPVSVVTGEGIPQSTLDQVVITPFNDLQAMEAAMQEHAGEISCVIIEPILCNLGMVEPQEGYLEGVRALCDREDILLIFDQVKTGVTVAYGGVTELYGVDADIHCLGKSIGGGMSVGAFGGREEIMKLVTDARVLLDGTFSGNPLTVVAGRAALLEVLTPEVYEYLEEINGYLRNKIESIIASRSLPFHLTTIGAKGGVFFSEKPVKNYREWNDDTDRRLAQLYWIWMANRGVWIAPGADEQWTLPCMITPEDTDIYLEAFESFADLTASMPEPTAEYFES